MAVCGGGASDGAGPAPSPQPAAWTLSWSDEFDAGSRPDESRWVYDLGGGGWGNQELQTYTSRAENAAVRDGALVITARAERFTGTDGIARDYTSARLKTRDRFAQTYGKFEARLQVPRGQGIWPAFWMLGVDIDASGWPQCGEIDIMENIGREPTTIHGTLHGPGYSGGGGLERGISESRRQAVRRRLPRVCRRVGARRDPLVRRWPSILQPQAADLPAGARWVFDHDFFLLLNVAVGGAWPGNPDATTTFPQEMKVDYVRVYRR